MHICNSVGGEGGEHDWGLTEVDDNDWEPRDEKREEEEQDCREVVVVVKENGLGSPEVTENGGEKVTKTNPSTNALSSLPPTQCS